MKPRTKRFRTCIGCPFAGGYGPYCTAPGVPLDDRRRSPRLEGVGKRGNRPPEWCPLRSGPITLALVVDDAPRRS